MRAGLIHLDIYISRATFYRAYRLLPIDRQSRQTRSNGNQLIDTFTDSLLSKRIIIPCFHVINAPCLNVILREYQLAIVVGIIRRRPYGNHIIRIINTPVFFQNIHLDNTFTRCIITVVAGNKQIEILVCAAYLGRHPNFVIRQCLRLHRIQITGQRS